MFTTFIIHCIIQIEATISTPPRNWFVNNIHNIRLCYRQGSIIKYIYLTSPEKAAAFFQKHGVIHYHAIVGEEVKMYVRKIVTYTDEKTGIPHLGEKLVPVTFAELEITPAMVQTFAAREEFENTAGIMGLVANLHRAGSKIFKAA